ncbi:hypothetical protein HDU93_004689 [Gonapodya sp. JEL0774]|nr:hypothetical protein HDU93_004689 [Gonapodya sp. JEL0774]
MAGMLADYISGTLPSSQERFTGAGRVQIVEHPDDGRDDRVLVAKPGDIIFTERPLLHTSFSNARNFRPDPAIPTLAPDFQRILFDFCKRWRIWKNRSEATSADLNTSSDTLLFDLAMSLLSTDGVEGDMAREVDPRRDRDYERGVRAFIKTFTNLVRESQDRFRDLSGAGEGPEGRTDAPVHVGMIQVQPEAPSTQRDVPKTGTKRSADKFSSSEATLRREGASQGSSTSSKRRKLTHRDSSAAGISEPLMPSEKELLHLLAVLETNCHSRAVAPSMGGSVSSDADDPDPPRDESVGLYLAGSFMDHSCAPNATVSLSPPKIDLEPAQTEGNLTLLCLRAISPGTPITISYSDNEFVPTQSRRQALLRRGFLCTCDACSCRDASRAGSCFGTCDGTGILAPRPSDNGSDDDDGEEEGAVEDPSGEVLVFECDICDTRCSTEEAQAFIAAEIEIEDDVEQQLRIVEGVLEVVQQWLSGSVESGFEKKLDDWSGLVAPRLVVSQWQKDLLQRVGSLSMKAKSKKKGSSRTDKDRVSGSGQVSRAAVELHMIHSTFYQFVKENLYSNPNFRIVFTHPEAPLHATIYLAAACLRILDLSASASGELTPLANSSLPETARVVFSEDLRHHFVWMAKMAKLARKTVLGRWAAGLAEKMSTIMYGEDSEERREASELRTM